MMTMLLLSKKNLRFQNQLGCSFSTFFQWAKKNESRIFARLQFKQEIRSEKKNPDFSSLHFFFRFF